MNQIPYFLTKATLGKDDITDYLSDIPLQTKPFKVEEVLGNHYKQNEVLVIEWTNQLNKHAKFKKTLIDPNEIMIAALASPFGFYSLNEKGEICEVTSQPI